MIAEQKTATTTETEKSNVIEEQKAPSLASNVDREMR